MTDPILERIAAMTRVDEAGLRICPFCSATKSRELKKTVQCYSCGAQGPYDAEDCDWNTRPADTLLMECAEEIKRLMEALHKIRVMTPLSNQKAILGAFHVVQNIAQQALNPKEPETKL